MPSKTAISEAVRKRKRTKAGQARKRGLRKKGTINYLKAFEKPALDEKKAS